MLALQPEMALQKKKEAEMCENCELSPLLFHHARVSNNNTSLRDVRGTWFSEEIEVPGVRVHAPRPGLLRVGVIGVRTHRPGGLVDGEILEEAVLVALVVNHDLEDWIWPDTLVPVLPLLASDAVVPKRDHEGPGMRLSQAQPLIRHSVRVEDRPTVGMLLDLLPRPIHDSRIEIIPRQLGVHDHEWEAIGLEKRQHVLVTAGTELDWESHTIQQSTHLTVVAPPARAALLPGIAVVVAGSPGVRDAGIVDGLEAADVDAPMSRLGTILHQVPHLDHSLDVQPVFVAGDPISHGVPPLG